MTMRKTSIGIILAFTKRPALPDCWKRAGVVPASYAGNLVQRLFSWYTENSIDLKAEYAKYYSPEYRSIGAFLYHKYGCTPEDVKALETDIRSNRAVHLVSRVLSSDGRIRTFLEGEGAEKTVARILGTKWVGAR